MSYWPIALIIIAIALAVGPIMIMKPSRRDQRLANLRQKAASLGLQVRMSDYEDRLVAVYSLPVKLPKTTVSWQLLKRSYTHGIHFYQKWQTVEDSSEIPEAMEVALKSYIDNLPSDIVGIEVSQKVVGIWWLENPNTETVDDIKVNLEKLHQVAS